MAHGPVYRVPFRRRREGRTDYRTRLGLLKSRKPRVVVRRTSRNVTVQFAEFHPDGDRILAQATAQELADLGWTGSPTSTPAAYLTGLLAGSRAKAAGIEEGVLDIGRRRPTRGSRVFGALKGVLDAGLDVPHGDDVLPADDRLNGAHMGDDVPTMVEAVKSKIGSIEVANDG